LSSVTDKCLLTGSETSVSPKTLNIKEALTFLGRVSLGASTGSGVALAAAAVERTAVSFSGNGSRQGRPDLTHFSLVK